MISKIWYYLGFCFSLFDYSALFARTDNDLKLQERCISDFHECLFNW